MANSLSLAEQAFSRLRNDVLIGSCAAGAKLKIEVLQASYGFSSSPLREALNRLVQEGLVQSDERRGFRVAPISVGDLEDITRMRLNLEVEALRESIRCGDDKWEAAIVAAYYRLEKVESRHGEGAIVLDDEWSSLHRVYHLTLISACPSSRQLAWSASLFDQAERYRRFSGRYRKKPRCKSDEHQKLMEATLRKDSATACELLRQHIQSTQRNVEELLHAGGSQVVSGQESRMRMPA